MKRLALLLLALAVPADAATLIINGVRTEGTVVITTGTPAPTPPPAQPPAPVPPPAACSGSPNRLWSPFNTVQLWPVPPMTGTGEAGISVAFVADSGRYPKGVSLGGVDESQHAGNDYVVAECPRSFVPVANDPLCARYGAGSTMGPISLRFGPKQPRVATVFGQPQILPSLDCALTPRRTYYINVRHVTRGKVSSQFVIQNRTD